MAALIHLARRRLVMVTPYFVPDEATLSALRIAALSGVDVQLILSASNNQRLTSWAQEAYYDELLRCGVRIALYEPQFLHAKHMSVDEDIAVAGAGLAFLWFNAHPAQVFMGDVGALALGGALLPRRVSHALVLLHTVWRARICHDARNTCDDLSLPEPYCRGAGPPAHLRQESRATSKSPSLIWMHLSLRCVAGSTISIHYRRRCLSIGADTRIAARSESS